jgi:hypothetical protein
MAMAVAAASSSEPPFDLVCKGAVTMRITSAPPAITSGPYSLRILIDPSSGMGCIADCVAPRPIAVYSPENIILSLPSARTGSVVGQTDVYVQRASNRLDMHSSGASGRADARATCRIEPFTGFPR